jgi:hypothetical protein
MSLSSAPALFKLSFDGLSEGTDFALVFVVVVVALKLCVNFHHVG